MSKDELINRYQDLNRKLAAIAFPFGISVRGLVKSFPNQSNEIREQIRPILQEQVNYLEELRSLDLAKYENVRVLRLSKN